MTSDASGFHFTGASGTSADFDNTYRLTAIRSPGELPISVSYGTDTITYSDGQQSIVVTLYPTGNPNAGLVASVAAGGETWSYAYGTGQYLSSVVGPDPSTPSPSDTVTWTYVYTNSLVTRVDRTSSAGTTTLGQWTLLAGATPRVSSADEQALEQPLTMTYYAYAYGKLKTTVKNSSGQVLALFDSTKGAVTAVTNTSGPAAPVAGGPGVPVPFKSVTFANTYSSLVKTQTDQNGNLTLYENYDAGARPGRVVGGWVDGPAQPGVFSSDDTYASLVETIWHPVLVGAGRTMDEAGGAEPHRPGGRVPPRDAVPDPRPRSPVHGGVRERSRDFGRACGEAPGA